MLTDIANTLVATLRDVLPIVLVLGFFQLVVLRRRPPNLDRILAGLGFVLVGLTLFLVGLEWALFPLGQTMAEQLTAPAFLGPETGGWQRYAWVYAFAAAIGFATTVAEPSLIAVALKAEEISGGAISAFGLRMAVAVGVALGVGLGAFRIVSGIPLPWFIIGGYIVVMLQTLRAPKLIIPLAYDSGGVTTSTVTVPIVAALGLGLAAAVPGRDPLIEGFGLIAFASLFPIMAVLAYAALAEWMAGRRQREADEATASGQRRREDRDVPEADHSPG